MNEIKRDPDRFTWTEIETAWDTASYIDPEESQPIMRIDWEDFETALFKLKGIS